MVTFRPRKSTLLKTIKITFGIFGGVRFFYNWQAMFAHLNTKSRNYQHLCQVSKSSYSNSDLGQNHPSTGVRSTRGNLDKSWDLNILASLDWTSNNKTKSEQLMMSCRAPGSPRFVAFEFSECFPLSIFYLSVEAQYKSIIWSLVNVFFFSPNLFQVLFLLMVGYTGVGNCNFSLLSPVSTTGLISAVVSSFKLRSG